MAAAALLVAAATAPAAADGLPLMASFSESAEHVRALAPLVDVIDVHAALLRRLPTDAEVARWTGTDPAGPTLDLVAEVLAGHEYLGRFA